EDTEARQQQKGARRGRGEGTAGGAGLRDHGNVAGPVPRQGGRADRGGGRPRQRRRIEKNDGRGGRRRRRLEARKGEDAPYRTHRRGGTLAPRTRHTLSWRAV